MPEGCVTQTHYALVVHFASVVTSSHLFVVRESDDRQTATVRNIGGARREGEGKGKD